ncbi:hypothetical protein ACC708_36625, partial [Rhizobium ruizarguesonis]
PRASGKQRIVNGKSPFSANSDFRGRSPLLIGLFRGLHCPLCRRHVAAMAYLNQMLREKGVQSLAVVNTPVERARLYFRYHPIP